MADYFVYIGQLRKEFAKSKKAKLKNENPDPNKHGLYVGISKKKPRERWKQHLNKERNKMDHFFQELRQNGEKIIFIEKNSKGINPISNETKAKKVEREIAIKYRDKGFATWSDALPYLKEESK